MWHILENFEHTEWPLTSWPAVLVASVAYLMVVYFLTGKKASNEKFFRTWFVNHNYLLSGFSFALLMGIISQLLPFAHEGLFYMICSEDMLTRPLYFFYYINYLTKYYELLDSFILLRMGKRLEFLHVYHHAMTMILCFWELDGKTAVQWVPITANLLTHTIMYYYYALRAQKKDVPWKMLVTVVQITQFVVDVAFCFYCTLGRWGHFPYFPFFYCAGTWGAAVFGCSLLTSYLVLFIVLFSNRYCGPKKGGSKKVKGE
mmetsp:Transcript_134650/g.190342  ORF Transcript_134650/g.190342 Transcript_134650/m.190342 type:complete len:259 (+) Transcript_134650:52-828(+)